jgi:predicted peroxiredoxin
MSDVLFWQASGHRESLVTTLYFAAGLKGKGLNVAVLFDKAAAAAIANHEFKSSPELSPYLGIVRENATTKRVVKDVMDYVRLCETAGVPLYTCGAWVDIVGVRDFMPPEIQVIEIPETMTLIAEARKVIGGP